jgi:hypothetical protein
MLHLLFKNIANVLCVLLVLVAMLMAWLRAG